MTVTCAKCGKDYDDARRWTFCPHVRFISPEDATRKDLAMTLLGKRVMFAHKMSGESFSVESVSWDGMVTVSGFSGQFAPHLFKVVG